MRVNGTPAERFWAKVQKTDTCWLWTASVESNGYGRFSVNRKLIYAHRFAYELLVGPIPAGLELDHVRDRGCTNRHCVNPAHLEPVTKPENIKRGNAGKPSGAQQLAKTHCPQGHEYNTENTRINPSGSRVCRTCSRDQLRGYRLAKKLIASNTIT